MKTRLLLFFPEIQFLSAEIQYRDTVKQKGPEETDWEEGGFVAVAFKTATLPGAEHHGSPRLGAKSPDRPRPGPEHLLRESHQPEGALKLLTWGAPTRCPKRKPTAGRPHYHASWFLPLKENQTNIRANALT